MFYIAFYDGSGRVLSVIPKTVKWASDMYNSQIPEGAAYCKAMMWDKLTLKPFMEETGCEIILNSIEKLEVSL